MGERIKFYVGTDVTIESGSGAIISCAGKLYSNCKFFPEITDRGLVKVLLVIEGSGEYGVCHPKGYSYNGSSWDFRWDTTYYPFRGWSSHWHYYISYFNSMVLKIKMVNGEIGGESCDVVPDTRFFMFGYVPKAMRPEEEWGEKESRWIHNWLKKTYGRED